MNLLKTKQVSEKLQISERKVRQLVAAGELAVYRIGGACTRCRRRLGVGGWYVRLRCAGMSEAEATVKLIEWNNGPTVQPPWSMRELARAVTRVFRR